MHIEKIASEEFMQWALTGGAGLIGRLMFHAKQVQSGRRKPFSLALLWDIPIALGMGWIALGLGTWMKFPWEFTISLGLITSYLGPYMIDTIFTKWIEEKFKKERS